MTAKELVAKWTGRASTAERRPHLKAALDETIHEYETMEKALRLIVKRCDEGWEFRKEPIHTLAAVETIARHAIPKGPTP